MDALQLLTAVIGLSLQLIAASCDELFPADASQAGGASLQDTFEQDDSASLQDTFEQDDSVSLSDILEQMAGALPEDIGCSNINQSTVEDWNGDGVPEVYLAGAGGWGYCVYCFVDGEMRKVEDLEPWSWTSGLHHTESGNLLLYSWPHTTGTAGICQHRIYEWTPEGYAFKEDLWSIPTQYEGEGNPVDFIYLLSDTAIDPFPYEDGDYADLQITQETYDREIADLGQWESVFIDGCFWETDWWVKQRERDSQEVLAEARQRVQRQILNWQ